MTPKELELFDATVKKEDDDIFVQPFCDFFGIDYDNQKKLIRNNPFLATSASKKTSMLLFGDKRERLVLRIEGFLVWVLQVKPQIVHPNLTEKLKIFQSNILSYLTANIKSSHNDRAILTKLYEEKDDLRKTANQIAKDIKNIDEKIREIATKGQREVLEFPFPKILTP